MEKEKEVVVECVNLEKKYFLFDKDYKIIPWLFTKKGCKEEITPLTNINLTINKGDVIGFIGKNGAGKSTLMKIIAGITMHTDGGLNVNGQVNSLINLGAGFNHKYTGRQNVYYKGLLMGLSKERVDEIIDEIIDFCELGHYFDLPLYMYSSGMSARLGFALAIFAEHDILIVDEVFAVGDKMFREKSSKKMAELFRSGKSIIFASHSDDQIRQFCNRAIFIDESRIVVDGTVDEALEAYNSKYAPKKNEDVGEKIRRNINTFNLDGLRKLAYQEVKEKADLYREIALFHERENNLDLAYKYMLYALKLRPNGPAIIRKSSEYKAVLGEEVAVMYSSDNANFNNVDIFMDKLNENIDLEPADLYREIATFHELEGNLEIAYKYISQAKELRPNGQIILQKFENYKKILNIKDDFR